MKFSKYYTSYEFLFREVQQKIGIISSKSGTLAKFGKLKSCVFLQSK